MVETIRQAKEWLDTVSFVEFKNDMEKCVIGQKNLTLVLAQVRNYIEAIAYGRPVDHNFIIAAPSGSGKTETYRALRNYFRETIPSFTVSITDVSQITATGFRGMDASEIVMDFCSEGDLFPSGICFLDEFDKKLIPSYTAQGSNVSAETQSNLLTLVEGTRISIPIRGSSEKKIQQVIDTSRIMFVGMGSFDGFRKEQEDTKDPVGFGREPIKRGHFSEITKEDMIATGALYELIGRFPVVINYERLSKEGTKKVIAKIAGNVGKTFNCDIDIKRSFESYLQEKAQSKFGCRELDGIIREAVLREYVKVLNEKPLKDKVLVVELINETKTSHKWRDLNKEEKARKEMIHKFFEEAEKERSEEIFS